MNFIPIHTSAIATLLRDRLQAIVTANTLALWDTELSASPIAAPQIPLYRSKQTYPIVYISPLALKLGKISDRSPMEIATAIADRLCGDSASESLCDIGGLGFTLTVVPPGKIYWQLSDRAIATWLQRAIVTNWQLEKRERGMGNEEWGERGAVGAWSPSPLLGAGVGRGLVSKPSSGSGKNSDRQSTINNRLSTIDNLQSIFLIQYAHARCCALLRLGDREGAIALETAESPTNPAIGALKLPDPIPWLDPQGQLQLRDPAELTLISQLVESIDGLGGAVERSQNTSFLTFASALSQDFLTFYREIQILGAAKIKNSDLTAARLGAIAATEKILKLLLEEGLGISAPAEL